MALQIKILIVCGSVGWLWVKALFKWLGHCLHVVIKVDCSCAATLSNTCAATKIASPPPLTAAPNGSSPPIYELFCDLWYHILYVRQECDIKWNIISYLISNSILYDGYTISPLLILSVLEFGVLKCNHLHICCNSPVCPGNLLSIIVSVITFLPIFKV